MAHPPLTVCLFCERPLEPNEPAVFRGKGKLGHIRCWRPDLPAKSADRDREVGFAVPRAGRQRLVEPHGRAPRRRLGSQRRVAPAGRRRARSRTRITVMPSHGRAISREKHNQRLPLHCE